MNTQTQTDKMLALELAGLCWMLGERSEAQQKRMDELKKYFKKHPNPPKIVI